MTVISNVCFIEWLWEQRARKDDVGRAARLTWHDYTSGCVGALPHALGWAKHFNKEHSAKAPELLAILLTAYNAYCSQSVSV